MKYRIAEDTEASHARYCVDALERAGWSGTDGKDAAFFFSTGMPESAAFARYRWVNHLPGAGAITRKDEHVRHVEAAYDRLKARGSQFDRCHPQGWLLPDQLGELQAHADANLEQWYILKPAAESCGRGIRIVTGVNNVGGLTDYVAQTYVREPLLVDVRKHVLRLYLLVTSVDPLVVWLHRDGFVKFCSRRWDETAPPTDLFVHLTNPDINRLNDELVPGELNRSLGEWRQRQPLPFEALWRRIRRALCMSLCATRHALREPVAPSGAFELLGADVMIDAHGTPWVMEFNFSPALDLDPAPGTAARSQQAEVKQQVVMDMLRLVGLFEEDEPTPMDAARFAREASRAGGFERLLPEPPLFDALADVQPADLMLLAPETLRFETARCQVALEDNGVSLARPRCEPVRLNDTAAFLWFELARGASGDMLVDALSARFKLDGATAHTGVCDAVAPLMTHGYLKARTGP